MLPNLQIPSNAPTPFLFFVASAVALYFSPEVPGLHWFARSAFFVFLGLGPLRWVETLVHNLRVPSDKRWGSWTRIGCTPVGIVADYLFAALQALGAVYIQLLLSGHRATISISRMSRD